MNWITLYMGTLALSILMDRAGIHRPRMLMMLPLIAVDVAGNVAVLGGSWRNTISGEAWNGRAHPWLGWGWRAIDVFFGKGHCRTQAEREAQFGGVWAAWRTIWRTG